MEKQDCWASFTRDGKPNERDKTTRERGSEALKLWALKSGRNKKKRER